MGFKELSSLDADVTVALGKKNKETGRPYPTVAEGYYLGKRAVKTNRGESELHFLQSALAYNDLGLKVGQNLGVWGTTDLNRKLLQVTPGNMVRVTSAGTKPTPNGDMYVYRVEVDSDNAIEVSTAEADYVSSEDDTTNDDTTYSEDDTPPRAAPAASIERVQGILNKGKTKASIRN